MNILFLTIANLKDINEKGIYTDLLKKFKNEGHHIYIASAVQKKLNIKSEVYIKEQVHYLRVKIGNITKVGKLEKAISNFRLENQYLKLIKKHYNNVKFDLILYPTPPITFSKVISYIKQRDKSSSYLLLKDIFPQNAVDLKFIKENSVIHKYYLKKEKELYRVSDYIGCMSLANVNFIKRHNKLPNKIIEVCPNSIDPTKIYKESMINQEIRIKYNIPLDKTVFIYGGNLGKPQGIDFLIDCLRSNKNNKKAFFIIVGAGTEFTKINQFFIKEQPENAKLFKQLPKEDYETLVNSCDVGLIFLDNRFTIPNFPSRLLSYMQASMPVLAATDKNTDIGQVIEQGKFGYWCESINVECFNNQLEKFYESKERERMGVNSRQYLERNYTVEQNYEIIMKHFK